jgi:hypothetical protein
MVDNPLGWQLHCHPFFAAIPRAAVQLPRQQSASTLIACWAESRATASLVPAGFRFFLGLEHHYGAVTEKLTQRRIERGDWQPAAAVAIAQSSSVFFAPLRLCVRFFPALENANPRQSAPDISPVTHPNGWFLRVSGENYPDFSGPAAQNACKKDRRMAKSTLFWFAEDSPGQTNILIGHQRHLAAVISWKGGSEARRGSNRALRG